MNHHIFTNYISKLLAVVLILSFLGAYIPPATAYAVDIITVNITASKSGNKLTVSVKNAQKNSTYFVKVDDATKGGIYWSKIGTLRTDKNKSGEGTYTLPNSLVDAASYNICLKNTATDELLCNNAVLTNRNTSTSSSSSSSSSSSEGTFTVTRVANYITIKTSGYPKHSFYNVKVADTSKRVRSPWYIIGYLKTRKNTSDSYTYYLSHKLKDATQLTVCLKNVITDEVHCVDKVQ